MLGILKTFSSLHSWARCQRRGSHSETKLTHWSSQWHWVTEDFSRVSKSGELNQKNLCDLLLTVLLIGCVLLLFFFFLTPPPVDMSLRFSVAAWASCNCCLFWQKKEQEVEWREEEKEERDWLRCVCAPHEISRPSLKPEQDIALGRTFFLSLSLSVVV